MSLKLNEMLEKANKKGISASVQKPWKEESVLNQHTENIYKIDEINPEDIINWEFHDRPANELGDIDSLAKDFINIGQQQPCVIRRQSSDNKIFELIIGERRWHAAKKAGVKLKCIIVDYDDKKAALAQATENDQRKNISDYAKGISYSKLIEQGVITQKELIHSLGKTKQYVSALLSFTKIPEDVIAAIGDMSKVSARTAEYIKQLCYKDGQYKKLLIEKASLIRDAKLGGGNLNKKLQKEYNQRKEPCNKKQESAANTKPFKIRISRSGSFIIEIPQYKQLKINTKQLEIEFNKIINLLLHDKNSPPSGT